MINEKFTGNIIAEIEKGMAATHQDSSSISNNDVTKYMVNLPSGEPGKQNGMKFGPWPAQNQIIVS